MLLCAEKVTSLEEGKALLRENIANGKGLEKLKEFIKAQGGDVSPIDNPELFPVAKYIIPVKAENDGYITKIKYNRFNSRNSVK